MLKAALASFFLAIFAYVLGVLGIAGVSMDIGRILLVAFLVFSVVGVSASVIVNDRPDDVL